MSSGERPTGAAKGKQSDTEALCQPPPPPLQAKFFAVLSVCLFFILPINALKVPPPPPAEEGIWTRRREVNSTQRSETGQVRGLRWHNRPREWEGKEWCEAC